jgi:TnpA family transposase
MRSFTTENDDTTEATNEDDIYKYLGHMQTKQMKPTQITQKLGDEYLNHTKSILKTKLNGKK